MTPQAYCAQKAASASSSFTAAFRLLDPRRRAAMEALYAFCREVDDVADDCSDQAVAQTTLNWWRSQLIERADRVSRASHQDSDSHAPGSVCHPVIQALGPVIDDFGLPIDDLALIITGVERDLYPLQFDDWAALDDYCDQVAGAVGRLSARIFGQVDEAVLRYASGLGLALQYTNILRDIGEDARRQRVYLPETLLKTHGLHRRDLLSLTETPQLIQALAELAERAHQRYDQALEDLPSWAVAPQRPGLVMAAIYRDLLRVIQESNYQVLHQRIALTPTRKLWLGLKTVAGWLPR
ncbi:MAG: presqualene diphosphate synthase HpnD [Burkholderiaceae bacterium]